MIRAHENPIALKAGALSFLVHVVLLGLLLLSFNWKVVQPASIATVELWSELPSKPVVQPQPVVVPPKPEPKVEIKPEPKPEPLPEPKADIQVKKEPPKPEKPKPKEEPKKTEVKKPPEPKKQPPVQDDELKKLQQALLEEDKLQPQSSPSPQGPDSSVQFNKGEMDKYAAALQSIIKPRINKQLCGTGKPVLEYQITLMPTGEILGEPKLLSRSGIDTCDEAVYRAIKLSSLDLPKPPSSIREITLKFRPND